MQSSSKNREVLLVTNIPTPYRIPLFNEVNSQLGQIGFSLKVIFAALGYERRKWAIDMKACRFAWEVLPPGRIRSRDREHALFTYPGLGAVLSRHPGAITIVGGFCFATVKLWLRSFWRNQPYLIWSGAIEGKGHRSSLLQRIQRKLLVSRAAGFLAYGTRAKEYLVRLGADPTKTHIAINTVDTQYYRDEAAKLRENSAQSSVKRILYVGNLEKGKRIDQLLNVIANMAATRQDFVLDIVGSGSCEAELKEMAATLGIEKRVQFHGFLQRPEIVKHLSQVYCFVFPSEYDVWGLVLVEAMAAGVPCISSIHAGATCDLVKDGDTGFAVDFEKTGATAKVINDLLDQPEKARGMAQNAASFIERDVHIRNSAGGFLTAVSRLENIWTRNPGVTEHAASAS